MNAFTAEQQYAIDRRHGDLLLDASAGSGKTSVLVERFARAVVDDGIEVGAILTITFTEKAAAELRDRIRARLRELGAEEAVRATEGAFISTIHGFCARVLRSHALAIGLDPLFIVLDEPEAARLADAAFEGALEEVADNFPGGIELIASYGAGALRGAIQSTFNELRSRGCTEPALPPLPEPPDLEEPRSDLLAASRLAAGELGAIAGPGVKVVQALERLDRVDRAIGDEPWPGELDSLYLPGGNGAALSTPICVSYGEALGRFREALEHRRAKRIHAVLDRLLRSFGRRYAAIKRAAGALDFEDLELLTHDLLSSHDELRERYAHRFASIMVDELQDTNAVQLSLIESIARDNLFTVGDAQQSIYGFRHADVELFERRGERLVEDGARATLRTNFRSRPEILRVLNLAFASQLGERFIPLRPGRTDPPATEPLVELIVADKAADWETEGVSSPWRQAEARALARRVRELIDGGTAPREIVVLTRATTDLRAYERALEDRGIPTYVIGGRGYWAHPQVLDLLAYLRALANPRDQEALYLLLASPLVGASLDSLVLVAATARSAGREPAWVLANELPAELAPADRDTLAAFASWFEVERSAVPFSSVEELIERALELTGYDLAMLAMPGGTRRLANVRKLMRLGREHEQLHGRDLRGFLELARGRAAGFLRDSRESEAPVEGEALDAIRLMTIHRAKGLEFEIVCVADLGRSPRWGAPLMRIGRDGSLGLRLSEPGTGKALPALDYKRLADEQAAVEAQEERRLFYVAMTRARERLIVSGAARLESWPCAEGVVSPIAWIGPALVPDIADRIAERRGVTEAGVRFTFVSPEDLDQPPQPSSLSPVTTPLPEPVAALDAPEPLPAAAPAPPVTRLSYSALGEYQRCGYRFYAERVLGLPAIPEEPGTGAALTGLSATERGIVLHALLERLDFRRPTAPPASAFTVAGLKPTEPEMKELGELVAGFVQSPLAARLARATEVRREERFAYRLLEPDGPLIVGALDVLAREPGGRMLVVDYKSDRLQGQEPAEVVAEQYATQRLVYALAVLLAGGTATAVEIAHVFLDVPHLPVSAVFEAADVAALGAELGAVAGGVLDRRFVVSETPQRALCHGCPAEGGLCSWPLAMTRREAPDRLF